MIRLLRRALPYLAAVVAAVLLYDGWVFYSRRQYRLEAARLRQEREAESARRTIDALGGGGLKVLNFYATPGTIRKGDHARLCYGVYAAKSVRIDPPVGELRPVPAHCLEVAPASTTEYVLTAEDGAGNKESERVLLRVVR